MATLRLARHAMATRFELVLFGDDPVRLRAAGEEALGEIERLEGQLSLFRPTSEIAHVNAKAAREPVRVTPAVYGLLDHARRLTEETHGAFDITIAPLMRCWGFRDGAGRVPNPEVLTRARANTGMHLVHLDPERLTVRFAREGVSVDLGAIGKGYAIERAVDLLREAGVDSALVHGGTSTIYGLGSAPDADSWRIQIPDPVNPGTTTSSPRSISFAATGQSEVDADVAHAHAPFATVLLRNNSLSVSAVWGKFFHSQGEDFGHIIDPRTGEPARHAVLSAVILSSPTETDALSTALLTLGPGKHDLVANLRPGIQTLVVGKTSGIFEVKSQGITCRPLCP